MKGQVSFKARFNKSIKRKTYTPKKQTIKRTGKKFLRNKKTGIVSIRVKSDGVSSTFDHTYNIPNAFMKKMMARYAPAQKIVNQQESPSQLVVTHGLQTYAGYGLFTTTDMQRLLGAAGLAATTGTGAVQNTAIYYFEKALSELSMTNSSNAPCEVTIYQFKCKRDSTQSPIQLWAQGLYDATSQSVINYATYYNNSPLDSVALNAYFKCFKIIHIAIQPGQNHVHRYTRHCCCPINTEVLNNTNNITYLKGFTVYDIIVVKGAPMSATTSSDVTSTQLNLNIIQSETTTWKYLQYQLTQYSYSNPSGFGTASNIYNQGSGASAAQASV
nr:MAG: capsid protein [Cressdnaviricota sp.]